MTTPETGTPTHVPGLFLRPVIWPEEAQLIVDVDNASRLAGGSLFVMNVEVMRAFFDHSVNSELASDLRLAECDGRPVGYVRVEWHDENRGDRVHGAALHVTPDAPAGAFGALRLYQKMGFREAARETEWRRPLVVDSSPAAEAGA